MNQITFTGYSLKERLADIIEARTPRRAIRWCELTESQKTQYKELAEQANALPQQEAHKKLDKVVRQIVRGTKW